MQKLPPFIVPFGMGPLFKDTRTGHVLTDQDRIARASGFAGEEPQGPGEDEPVYTYEGAPFDNFGASSRRPSAKSLESKYESAILSENVTVEAAGDVTIKLRAQHPFKATDMTFEGSPANTLIKKIDFGDKNVFKTESGVPATMFNPTSQLRKYLEGKTIRAGLDIIVTIYMAGAGTAYCTFMGYKPKGD